MIYLLCISVGYLLLTSLIMWMNAIDFKPLLNVDRGNPAYTSPLVSIGIPARNEEKVIARAVQSVLNQSHSAIEIIILDDQSTDNTPKILQQIKENNPERVELIQGKRKPDNWLGKSWACHQISQKASGDILFFIDADVWLEPQTVSRCLKTMQFYDIDFITLWPLQAVGTFWEKVVIPIIYYGLLSLLPARYVHRKPAWLPPPLARKFSPFFAAACGQAMFFRRNAYDAIGGHASVKNEIVEDVALAKQIKRHGYKMRMCHGDKAAHCRMYTSHAEMWQGFRKNFLGLYNYSVPAFSVMAFLNFIVYVAPFVFLPVALLIGDPVHAWLSFIAVLLIVSQRLVLAKWFGFSYLYSFTHPLGILWFHLLGVQVLTDYFAGNNPEWKDRPT